MGLRTLFHAVVTAGNGRGLRVHFLRSQAARFALSLLLLASLPIFSDMVAVRAGFVVRVEEVGVKVGDAEVAKKDLTRGTAVAWSEGSPSQRNQSSEPSSELKKSYEAWIAILKNGLPNAGDAPSRPGPAPRGPQPPTENQGCQGTGGGVAAAGSAVQPAGLPAAPVIVGPDLAMRLFAREAHFNVEDFASRLFRPPRSV